MKMSNFAEVRRRTKEIETAPSLDGCKKLILSIIGLLDSKINTEDLNLFELFTDDGRKLAANASWFISDSKVKDHKATYQVHEKNKLNIDFKMFGVQSPSKRVISWSQALTPNFEDEPFYEDFRVGIDFIVPKTYDRILVALSNNYVVRILELHGDLTATYEEIFSKWESIDNFSNKKYLHTILWESFDLSPINKRFYEGIAERFVSLRQFLTKQKILDEGHAAQFANRLLGRIIFAWFLEKKGLLNSGVQYFNSGIYLDDTEYYKAKLESLFFEVLNTPLEERIAADKKTPYLNGGLFEPKKADLYQSSKLAFPKNYFDDLYQFLRAYNFTTDESTSSFQQVAIDPEMLGQIFENLLAEMSEESGDQARKAKGAFYTPREVVDYMCRESLKAYLRNQFQEDEFLERRIYQLVDAPDREFQDQDHNWRRDWKPYKDKFISSLDQLKVLDPACGSGAFPIGMLQLLLSVYSRLEPRFDSHKAKLAIVERNIYGVDIEPMAVEISRLRAWLSLVVDVEDGSSKVEPLPNLDFKFVCANSLLPLEEDIQESFGDDPELDLKLRAIREQYFNTNKFDRKNKLRIEYNKLVKEEQSLFGESYKTTQLKSFRPFENEASAIFFDSEYMFGLKKFDIVIGNPPYGAKVSDDHKKKFKRFYKSASTESGTGRGSLNTYTVFIELALNLLSTKGNLNYIVPISVCSSESSMPLHGLLEKQCETIKISSFAVRPQPVFLNAMVNTSILHAIKTGKPCNSVSMTKMYRKRVGTSMSEILASIKFIKPNGYYIKGRYPKISDQIELDILKKLNDLPCSLSDYLVNEGSPVYYRAAGGRYFKIITPFSTASAAEKSLTVADSNQMAIGAILSSNLYFWFYQVYSDNLNLKKTELESFPMPSQNQLSTISPELSSAYAEFLEDIKKNVKTRKSENYAHVKSFQEYKLGKSKKFIDRLDETLANVFGLTQEELNFIVNYEISSRLSDSD
jgi:type I restriction-modification system DNA methylase subunit